MNSEQFTAIMPIISADLAQAISARQRVSNLDAVKMLYNSRLYSMLEKESTKLWHYSTDMLYSLFSQEQQTGSFELPDV